MNIEKIRKRFRGKFKPFKILTRDGHEYRVPQWGTMALGKHEVVVMDRAGEMEFLDPLQIASIKTVELLRGDE